MEESEDGVGQGEGGGGGGGGGGGRGGEDEQKGQRPLGCLSESLGMSRGSLLEASWGVLGASWRSQGLLGASWVLRGEPLGASWGPLGGILGASWRHLGASRAPPGAILEAIDQQKRTASIKPPPRSLKHRFSGSSWGALEALLGALGAVSGPSWASLATLLGHIGAILRPQEPIGSEKARRQKTLVFLRFLKDFGLSGASLGGSLAS